MTIEERLEQLQKDRADVIALHDRIVAAGCEAELRLIRLEAQIELVEDLLKGDG